MRPRHAPATPRLRDCEVKRVDSHPFLKNAITHGHIRQSCSDPLPPAWIDGPRSDWSVLDMPAGLRVLRVLSLSAPENCREWNKYPWMGIDPQNPQTRKPENHPDRWVLPGPSNSGSKRARNSTRVWGLSIGNMAGLSTNSRNRIQRVAPIQAMRGAHHHHLAGFFCSWARPETRRGAGWQT